MSILLSLPRLACAVQCTLYLGYTQISPELTSGKSAECVYLYFYCTLKLTKVRVKKFWSSVSRGSVNNWKLFNLICSFHPEIEDKRQKLCGATSDLIRICGECFLYFLSRHVFWLRTVAASNQMKITTPSSASIHLISWYPVSCYPVPLLVSSFISLSPSSAPETTVHCPDHGFWTPRCTDMAVTQP